MFYPDILLLRLPPVIPRVLWDILWPPSAYKGWWFSEGCPRALPRLFCWSKKLRKIDLWDQSSYRHTGIFP